MLYDHWSQVPNNWDAFPAKWWKPEELASRGDGSLFVDRGFVSALDLLRSSYGSPLACNSSYRDPRHNALVGGSPLSRHKMGDAADISTVGIDRDVLLRLALEQGWDGIGLYNSFLHIDRRGSPARWGNWS